MPNDMIESEAAGSRDGQSESESDASENSSDRGFIDDNEAISNQDELGHLRVDEVARKRQMYKDLFGSSDTSDDDDDSTAREGPIRRLYKIERCCCSRRRRRWRR